MRLLPALVGFLVACRGAADGLRGVSGSTAAVPAFLAHAQDGTARDASWLLGHRTVIWFFPSAGTYG